MLYGIYNKVMPLLPVRKVSAGIKCITFHYLFEREVDQAFELFRVVKQYGDFITTQELLELVARRQPTSGLFFHLSIDDGFDNIAEFAHPIFKDLRIPYTFFVCPEFVGRGPVGEHEFMHRAEYARMLPLANWPRLRGLAREGVEIGSHTRSHARLSTIGNINELREEIVGAKQEIEDALGLECMSFAWPFGKRKDIDDRGLDVVEKAGYRAMFGGMRGTVCPEKWTARFFPRHHFEPGYAKSTVLYYLTRID
jgi:peptidoglycan/xylan/chitin deacetylase (PgdA/CDA1 family)